MTGERLAKNRFLEQEPAPSKTFKLAVTNERIDTFNGDENAYPIFYVPLMPNDVRLFKNLQMKIVACDSETKTLSLEFREAAVADEKKFTVGDIKLENNKLKIGNEVTIVCRQISKKGRAELYMSVLRNIKVHGNRDDHTTLVA